MATFGTINSAGSAGGTSQTTSGNAQATVAVVPFIRASQEHLELAVDTSKLMTTADQDLGSFPIPAYGYLRSLLLVVSGTAETVTTAVGAADAPFCALKNITVSEPNGAVICQFNSGYDLFLANKYGGYRYCNDPRQSPAFTHDTAASASTDGFSFVLRIPLEINLRDALGSLPNQNAAATFNLRVTLAASGDVYASGTITTKPTVRLRVYSECWDQPEISGAAGSNQTTPPAMNTTQYWSVQQYAVPAGAANVRLTRMGNYLRQLIFVFKTTAGARAGTLTSTTDFPDPTTIYWDTRPQETLTKPVVYNRIYERYGYTSVQSGVNTIVNAVNHYDGPGGLDTGVVPYDFAHEFNGQVGRENRDLWLPTLGSTRFEVGGTWGQAGTLYVLTNDVSVAGNVFL